FLCSSVLKTTGMILAPLSIAPTSGGLVDTSGRVGRRPLRVMKVPASSLKTKLPASLAAFGCGASVLTPTDPKINGTGSISQKSVGAPDIFTFSVRGRKLLRASQ